MSVLRDLERNRDKDICPTSELRACMIHQQRLSPDIYTCILTVSCAQAKK